MASGSPPSVRSIGPPSRGRQPTSGRSRNSSGRSCSSSPLTIPPLPSATPCPSFATACLFAHSYRALLSVARGGRFRQRYAPQTDLLRLSGTREDSLAGGHHSLLPSSGQRPRTLGSARTHRAHLWPTHRGSQLPLAQDQPGVGAEGHRASGSLLLQEERPYPEKECLPQSASLPN
jgi:hypothetical protein